MQPVVCILLLATSFAAVHYASAIPASYMQLQGCQEAKIEKESIQALLDELEQAALVQVSHQEEINNVVEKVRKALEKATADNRCAQNLLVGSGTVRTIAGSKPKWR